ncbi:SemiSWEET transporter [Pendulispora albinea]|uniref:SemiSWEET transporter n=1 Tax=Pendulispora albinea TaxID=2741071 RepID=A0ABZ2LW85_9BACT
MAIALSELVGYVAASLTTAALIPQALLIWRTRRAEGVSIGMYIVFSTGVALWIAYGLSARAWPVVVANVVTLGFSLWILAMKLRFERATRHGAKPMQ